MNDFDCLSVNTITPEALENIIIKKFSGHGPMVKREAKFEHGCIGVRGRLFDGNDVLLCNGDAP